MKYQDIIRKMDLELVTEDYRGFNFRCPICGDSENHKEKKRGWLYSNKNYLFHCYNKCGSLPFKEFVKLKFPNLLPLLEYSIDGKINEYKNRVIKQAEEERIIDEKELIDKKYINPKLYKVRMFENLNETAFPKLTQQYLDYCHNRLLPQTLIDGLRYCDKEFSKEFPFGQMLIFPFYAREEVYGFQGRRIEEKRFYIYSQDDFKIYNVFNVDVAQDTFIFEGIIDSSYKQNSIAMLGADLSSDLNRDIVNKVFAFDNDETGSLKALQKAKLGEKVFFWPNSLKHFKDINEFVCSEKITAKQYYQIEDLFNENVCFGKEAEAKLKFKCQTNGWETKRKPFVKKEYDKIAHFKNQNKKFFQSEQADEDEEVGYISEGEE